ncbi:essential MCU regulator, mitochondrial [Contarinia nasturtii]|uniref:essential MCU regulator, mitochondrial n=1 Tax=Contarinia nasturtii TaxID=265458 RepID=UPI0012D4963A|nr:essential MCU regulator, mitochondrial [Contarinia nasturtii]
MFSLLQKYVALQRLASGVNSTQIRCKTHYRTGAFKPMPAVSSFGLLGIICSVVPGLFIGAAISKNVANFLEENDLFVPSDDDDDED